MLRVAHSGSNTTKGLEQPVAREASRKHETDHDDAEENQQLGSGRCSPGSFLSGVTSMDTTTSHNRSAERLSR